MNKSATVVGSHVRTGSHNVFVAPVSIGDGAYTGAGTVVRKDVPAGSLAITVAPQRNMSGWVEANRAGTAAARAAVDAGLKALSGDMGPARVAPPLRADYTPAGDEHGRLTGALAGLAIGDRVRLVPSHADTTILLHHAFHTPEGERLPVGSGSV